MADGEVILGVDDPTNPNPTPSLEVTPSATPPTETLSDPSAKVPYTPEEMRSLKPEDIDTARIPAEHQAFYKALQANYTKAHQGLAEERKKLTEVKPKEDGQKLTIFDHYDRDPEGVMNALHAAIAEAKRENPFGEKVARLEQTRDSLLVRQGQKNRMESEATRIQSEAQTEIAQGIPDFSSKAEALTNFAMTEFGFSAEEVDIITNPLVMGKDLAVKLTKLVDKAYTRFNAGKTANTKVDRTALDLERPGGTPPATASYDVSKMTMDEYTAARNAGRIK